MYAWTSVKCLKGLNSQLLQTSDYKQFRRRNNNYNKKNTERNKYIIYKQCLPTIYDR